MKKILLIFALILTLSAACFAFTACGDENDDVENDNDDVENDNSSEGLGFVSNDDGTCYVANIGTCTDTDIVIPSVSPEGWNVTSIGEGAFVNCDSLTSVTIGNSVTSIGNWAFWGCTGLTSVTIGNSVTSIGITAFYKCTSLTSVTIGNSVTSIGKSAFSYCSSLKSVTIGNSVTSIGDYAFSDCSSLKSVTIGNSVTSIGDYAFLGCYGLTNITVSEGNTAYKSIDGNLYSKDGKILIQYAIRKTDTSFVIPDSVTSIGYYAFYCCTSLKSVTIGNSVTSIGDDAFHYCDNLIEVVNNSSLNITAGSTSNGYIGYYAKEVHKGESKIVNYNDYLFYTYDGVNYLLGYAGRDKALVLPESYKGENYKIYNHAFAYCTSLTSVTIPDSVTSIGYRAFYNCTGLTIYCEAASKPSGWHSQWNSSGCPVVWGYKG